MVKNKGKNLKKLTKHLRILEINVFLQNTHMLKIEVNFVMMNEQNYIEM